jgi:hypothetical protein
VHTDDTPRTGVRTVTVPELPARSGLDAEKVYDVLLIVLGLVGATVSGWSIATLLHEAGGMPWLFAAVGVGVYDLLAFMAGLMVYIRRHEPHRAVGAQAIMLAAIGGSAYVNYMHGRQVGGDLVALVFGAAPVVFEVAFAMRHNVLSVVTSVLFPRAMWRRYKDGVWINLHTGSLPAPSALVPEASGSPSVELPEAPEAVRNLRPDLSGPGNPRTSDPQVTPVPEASGSLTEWTRDGSGDPEAMAEVLPMHFRKLPEGTEARAEAVAEALRKGERITGETVAAMYGVSDRTGRTYIRRAKEINAAREDA